MRHKTLPLILVLGLLLLASLACNLTDAPAVTATPTIQVGLTPDAEDTTEEPDAAATEEPLEADPGDALDDEDEAAVDAETVSDWQGLVVANAASVDQPLALQRSQNAQRVSVTSTDAGILNQLTTLADSSATVHVWGTLYRNTAGSADDVLYVSALEAEEAPSSGSTGNTSGGNNSSGGTTGGNTSGGSTGNTLPVACTLTPRLTVGASGRVAPGPIPNALRSAPGTTSSSTVLGSLPGGTVFTVLAGPTCANGYNWWQVNANGFIGWTAEGQSGIYWLDPLSCANGLNTRLQPGQLARVTYNPPIANAVRSQPHQGASSQIVGEIPPGGVFTVLAGPTCGSGMAWWQVNYNGLVGWTAEGNTGVYWLEDAPADGGTHAIDAWQVAIVRNGAGLPYPLAAQTWEGMLRVNVTSSDPGILSQLNNIAASGIGPVLIWGTQYVNDPNTPDDDVVYVTGLQIQGAPPTPACGLESRLRAGYSAAVAPGLPNVVRSAPGTGGDSRVLGNLVAGRVIRVIEGPRCVDGYTWWRIVAPGLEGWTAEGQGSGTYWVDPIVCGNGMYGRMVPGLEGRVSLDPPLANAMRSAPSQTSTLLGEIPPGGVFSVMDGPECGSDGRVWWEVYYGGQSGWTAEGDNGVYWLTP